MRRAARHIMAALIPALLIAAGPASAAGTSELGVGEAGFSGYLKTYAIGIFPKEVQDAAPGAASEAGWQVLGAARLNGSWRPVEAVKTEAAYEVLPVLQSRSAARLADAAGALGSSLPLAHGTAYRVEDLDADLSPSTDEKNRLFQNLDRLAAYWSIKQADISVGRQAIAFGTARAIQATDVLLPYSFQQLSVEYRIGVDAVRVQVPVSRMGELDLGVVGGEKLRTGESAAFARMTVSPAETDLTAMAMVFSDAKLLGGGVQRPIRQFGYFLDFAQVWAREDERYFRLSQGLDYAFPSGLMLFGEYHYNGAGTDDPSGYLARLDRFAYRKGGVFLLGKHYGTTGLEYPVTPLLNSRMQAMVNLRDGSVFLSGGIEYGLSENIYLDLGFFGTIGRPPRQAGEDLTFASEFGSYPDQAYGAARWYF